MSASASGGMDGMNVSATAGSVQKITADVNGVPKPVASQVLAAADWQGMKIVARTMTPVKFVIFNGAGKEKLVTPARNASFHLMVMLNDAHTGVAIPYATVWATITKNGKTIYSQRQWPMISEYMGPHYGANVTLPGPGQYTISLLISPPVSARHIEYENVWLKPHRVTGSFSWKGSA